MTKKEKIAELINIRDNFNYTLAPREVFDDAIKALEQQPSEDCVSRKAVLKAIKEWWRTVMDADGNPTLCDDIIVLPSVAPAQEWIPCSNRLPEEKVEVLVTTEWGNITIAERYSAKDYFINDGAANADEDEITAWMPLPKPYEQKDKPNKDCEHCSKTYGTLGCCDFVNNKLVYSCENEERGSKDDNNNQT